MTIISPLSQIGHKVIRARAAEVTLPLGDADKQTVQDLIDTLHPANLVGIAAPQIGRGVRIFVTELRPTEFRKIDADPLRVFINPEILEMSEEKVLGYEGCGSVAHSGLFGEVYRAHAVTVRYFDEHEVQHTRRFEGFLARVIQHEFDHIEGTVFLDRLHTTKTVMSGSVFRGE